MANDSSFRAGVVGPGPDLRFDHCTPLQPCSCPGGSRRSNMQLHTRRDTPDCGASNVVHVAGQPCLGHLMRTPPPGERDQVLLSKPRQSLPYQCFANAMRDRNAPRVRKRHVAERPNLLRPLLFFGKAAYSPKHSGCTVSPGGRSRAVLPAHCQFRLLVIFPAPRTSAKLCGDKHKNFIGLKDVPAPIAIFRSQRH